MSAAASPAMSLALLDNVFWHCLTGPHARHACGARAVRRYAPGFSPMLAFEDAQQPDFDGLRPFVTPGERLYCSGWRGTAPDDWRVEVEAGLVQMVWDAPAPAAQAFPQALPLGPAHVAQALELTALTHPGPFGPRTIELGDYFGCFEDGRLIAMAGERLQAGTLHEISGVCTHPQFQGRGLARRLMLLLIDHQQRRGETPFLHVMGSNATARDLYRRMGFREHAETVVRIVSLR